MRISTLALIVYITVALPGCNNPSGTAASGADRSPGSKQTAAAKDTPDAAGSKPVPVILERAAAENFPYEIEALGTANANESIVVTTKNSNVVTAIHFREGQTVRRGDILVELDSVEVGAGLAAARAALAESQRQYKRSKDLLATQALSQAALDQIDATLQGNQARVTAAESKVRDTIIRAPFDGRIGLRRVSLGSLVGPGTLITTLDDDSTIKLDFSVPENFISLLREGMTVTARSVAFKDREFKGVIASIDSRVDPVTRSLITRALIPNPVGLLKPGMFLTVHLQQPRRPAVMISEQALVPEEGRQYVFVVDKDRAEKRAVRIGRRKPGRVEILSGLAAGENIVSEGTQSVHDGSSIRDAGAMEARRTAS